MEINKSHTFILTFAMVLLLLGVIISPITAMSAESLPEFHDITNQSQATKDAIMKLAILGVMVGGEGLGGSFRPSDNLTRAEFAKIVCHLSNNVDLAKALAGVGSKFADVSTGQWYTGWINAATQLNYFEGFFDATFRPNTTITMQEVVTVLLRIAGYDEHLGGKGGLGIWPANYIGKAFDLGILNNVTFVGNNPITRADVAVICNAILDIRMVVWLDLSVPYAASRFGEDEDGFAPLYWYLKDGEDYEGHIILAETILHKFLGCTNLKVPIAVDGGFGEVVVWGKYYPAIREDNSAGEDFKFIMLDNTNVAMASQYYICNGFALSDFAGTQADIIVNNQNEILIMDNYAP